MYQCIGIRRCEVHDHWMEELSVGHAALSRNVFDQSLTRLVSSHWLVTARKEGIIR